MIRCLVDPHCRESHLPFVLDLRQQSVARLREFAELVARLDAPHAGDVTTAELAAVAREALR